MRRSAAVGIFLLLLPAAAAAQVDPGYVPVTSVPAVPVAPAATVGPSATPVTITTPEAPVLVGLARLAHDDAAADRAFGASTAIVAPAGTTTFTLRAPIGPLVNAQIGYSLSDRVEVGIGTVAMFDSGDEASVMSFHGKVQLWRGPRAALAASFDLYRSTDQYDSGHLFMPSLVASMCTDGDACRTLLSLHLTGIKPSDGNDKMPILPGASLAMGGRNKLLLEAHMYNDQDSGDGFVVGFTGMRFARHKMSFDAGFGFYLDTSKHETYYADGCIDYCGDSSSDPQLVPWPFVGVSSRL